ncbi:hypothetical protein H0H81_002595 [Sphagnurus paluster]|uniref:GST N-terminal domain-containing protein n=1 Tax=Sphagnurus paluster TaxID=117069 RepID=A0A9P7KHE7_9AGAR|nr:hypothetical protein H0H81_002595 [Sphagnurus paluster]
MDYTLPAIYDPSTDTTLAESASIAEYLDTTYPDTPRLFPPGTRALQYAFVDAFTAKLRPISQFVVLGSDEMMNPPSQAYIRRYREAAFGKRLEEIPPTGVVAEEEWAKFMSGWDVVGGWLERGKSDGPFFLGKEPIFVDFVVASFLMFMKKVWGEESAQWKDLSGRSGGRWGMFLKALEKYEIAV